MAGETVQAADREITAAGDMTIWMPFVSSLLPACGASKIRI
jgi:hypothetical protein